MYSPRSCRFCLASCSRLSCASSSSISASAAWSFASVFSSSYTSVITASARLSRKKPPVKTSRRKYTTVHPVRASMVMYMRGVHPSSVMH